MVYDKTWGRFRLNEKEREKAHKPVAETTEQQNSFACHERMQGTTMKTIMAVFVLMGAAGCANSDLNIQPVEDDPSLFVGLARAFDANLNAEIRHNHPVEWNSRDLQAILKRLSIQESRGLMESSKPPQAVFPPGKLDPSYPRLGADFQNCQPFGLGCLCRLECRPKNTGP